MKHKIITLLAVAGLITALPVVAATAGQEQTITGAGACAKCQLKETKECQLTITTEKDGKPVTYYLAENAVADAFGKPVCHKQEKLTATGTVKMVDGKHILVPTKIEVAKQ